MEYEMFERDFIARTLKILDQYQEFVMTKVPEDENFQVTLLINSLLGLLVLPKERCYEKVQSLRLDQLTDWGLHPDFIKNWGASPRNQQDNQPHTLGEIVRRLRNSVAHMKITTSGRGKEITELHFSDKNGFQAVLPVKNLKNFVTKLAQALEP